QIRRVRTRLLILPRPRVHRPGVPAQLPRLDRPELTAQLPLRHLLPPQIPRRPDPQPARVHRLPQPRLHLPPHLLHEVRRRLHHVHPVPRQLQLLPRRRLRLHHRHQPLLHHPPEHHVPHPHRVIRVHPRIQPRRRPHDPREQRRLRQRQLRRPLPEIFARRRVDPPGAVPEIDLVQIELQDLLLVVLRLDLERHPHLRELPRDRPLVRRQPVRAQVPPPLPRDRAEPLPATPRPQTHQRRPT